MKQINALLFGLTLVIVVCCLNVSCEKNGSILPAADSTISVPLDPNTTPKFPTAIAGQDEYFMLPQNSTVLDGSASSSPGANIVSYEWVKISGPDSYKVEKTNAAVTNVTGLIKGLYVFKLIVTNDLGFRSDHHGFTSLTKDTTEIGVNVLDYKDLFWRIDTAARMIFRQTPELPNGFEAEKISGVWGLFTSFFTVGSQWREIKKEGRVGDFLYKVENNRVVVYGEHKGFIDALWVSIDPVIIQFE